MGDDHLSQWALMALQSLLEVDLSRPFVSAEVSRQDTAQVQKQEAW